MGAVSGQYGGDGRPSFSALQNAASPHTPIVSYAFDLLMLAGRELKGETLTRRRELLEAKVLPKLTEPVRYLTDLDADLSDLIASVRAQSLEGLVAKRRESHYERASGPGSGRRCA